MIHRSELETLVKRRTDDLIQAEDPLHQSQKLDAIGRLAGGVAHDFNNLLAVVMACSELVIAELDRDHPARAEVDEILAASQRAASLTRQLLAFSRKESRNPKVIADVVESSTRCSAGSSAKTSS